MKDYSVQIKRIKEKIQIAKETDIEFKVFGADSHKYIINKPATIKEVEEFENKYSIELPDCYRSFVTKIGNGGISSSNSATGPNYGIYPVGENVNELIFEDTEKYLKRDCIISPSLTDECWEEITKPIARMEHNSTNEDYIKQEGYVFGGILPISSSGCSYLSGIVLNGKYKGRILYIDYDLFSKPIFTEDLNFLDWYENWLDKIISSELITKYENLSIQKIKKWYEIWK